jgi:hypothetical protein
LSPRAPAQGGGERLVERTPFYGGAVGDEAPFVGDATEALERILLSTG